jgi:hypothetical protein
VDRNKQLEAWRIRSKRLRDRRLSEGLCPRCGGLPSVGVSCEKCKDTMRVENLLRYKARRKEGSCSRCRKPSQSWLCDSCNENFIYVRSHRQDSRSENNLCPKCGVRGPSGQSHNERGFCEECIIKERGYEKKRRDTRRAEGKCTTCGNPLDPDMDMGKTHCLNCNQRRTIKALGGF